MNGFEFVFLLFLIRLVVPIGLLLIAGEWMHRKNANYWLKW
jgi:hypothetical protein